MNLLFTILMACQIDYTYCAGRILQKQADYNFASAMVVACGGESEQAEMINLAKLPQFEDAYTCGAHTGACGYGLMLWHMADNAKWNEAIAKCK
jgi:hypothetical protein